MKKYLIPAFVLLFASSLFAASLKPVLKNKQVKAALKVVEKNETRMVEEWIALTEIESPSMHEDERAEYMMRRFSELGLSDIRRDGFGNVLALLPGKKPSGKWIVFDAHLDTVVKPGTEVIVKREDGKLHGAGVEDDTSGLIGLLYMLEAIQSSGLRFDEDLLFLATVQEEIGIHGAKDFIENYGGKVGKYVSVDGGLGGVSYGATSIFWYKFHFTAKGSHTLSSYQKPSTTHAAAKAIEDLYDLPLTREPEARKTWLNVGMTGAGEVVNAQSRDTWFTVDLRSNGAEEIAAMEAKVIAVVEAAASQVGVNWSMESLQKMHGAQIEGFKESEFVQTALEILEHLGIEEPKASMLGASNHNAAIAKGIPGINIGVTKGEGAHTPTEWAEIEPLTTGVKQLVLMAAALGGV